MKRILSPMAALALLALAPAASAQSPNYQPVRVDLTVFGAYGSADVNAYGFGGALEPKYNVMDRLAVGFRFEGAAFVVQKVTVGPAGTGEVTVSQNVRTVSAYLLKGDWYVTTAPVRPFVGLGFGLYRMSAASQEISGSGSIVQQAKVFSGFGFCPQLGVNFGGFRLAAIYHVVTGGNQVYLAQAVGAAAPTEVELPKSYFAFEIGGTFGGKRLGM